MNKKQNCSINSIIIFLQGGAAETASGRVRDDEREESAEVERRAEHEDAGDGGGDKEAEGQDGGNRAGQGQGNKNTQGKIGNISHEV